jgi:hypothetical protein
MTVPFGRKTPDEWLGFGGGAFLKMIYFLKVA